MACMNCRSGELPRQMHSFSRDDSTWIEPELVHLSFEMRQTREGPPPPKDCASGLELMPADGDANGNGDGCSGMRSGHCKRRLLRSFLQQVGSVIPPACLTEAPPNSTPLESSPLLHILHSTLTPHSTHNLHIKRHLSSASHHLLYSAYMYHLNNPHDPRSSVLPYPASPPTNSPCPTSHLHALSPVYRTVKLRPPHIPGTASTGSNCGERGRWREPRCSRLYCTVLHSVRCGGAKAGMRPEVLHCSLSA